MRRTRALVAMLVMGALAVPPPVVGGGPGTRTAAPEPSQMAIEVAAESVGAPAWWDGVCDATHWDAEAAKQGWAGPWAAPLGASYLGVIACGPGPVLAPGAPDVLWARGGWGHFEWECTELAFRFMDLVYGVRPYGGNGMAVVKNYRASYGGGLTAVRNGTVGRAPAPGDVISFSNPDKIGHVAIVTAADVDASGNGAITVMSQNDTADGWRTLLVNNWKVASFGANTPTEWLHKNVATFDEFPVGTSITSQYASEGMLFGGDSPFITDDWANPTFPVLSSSPLFHGAISVTFVVPGTTRKTAVSHVDLDVGYIDTPDAVEVVFYAPSGKVLKRFIIGALGIVHVASAGRIGSVLIHEVGSESAGFAVDNVAAY